MLLVPRHQFDLLVALLHAALSQELDHLQLFQLLAAVLDQLSAALLLLLVLRLEGSRVAIEVITLADLVGHRVHQDVDSNYLVELVHS
jgi:hypothetical protein